MRSYGDILLASYQAALQCRLRAAKNNRSIVSLGAEAMEEAIKASEGAYAVLKEHDLLEEQPPSDGCAHDEDDRVSMTGMGTLPRFFCKECHGFFEQQDDGTLAEYQEKGA